jgi:tetratricopeptide (TPR) repeat protein
VRKHVPIGFVVVLLLLAGLDATAAPFIPKSDQQVLETLPARSGDPRMQEIRELRRQLSADPRNVDVAARLARRYYAEAAAEGDPRYIGYAQAALAAWWNEPDPPVPARVVRAIVLQFGHQFDAALADLHAAVEREPNNGEAWAWLAAISMVRADYVKARRACERMVPLASPLIGVACIAQVDGVTGKGTAAAAALQSALLENPRSAPDELLWALTRLAEVEERRGEYKSAEDAYRRALALGINDGYLWAAYADFLLDRGRPSEVIALLKDKARSDLLLLRLALAAKATNTPELARWEGDLAARFDAARLRGDTLHQKEESRFALGVQGQAQRALVLARENYAAQREPADARILLEAALAAKQPATAEPALKWMVDSGIESVVLKALAQKLKGVN